MDKFADNFDAPQWTDFTAPSPQVSLDDYFMKRSGDHKYRENCDSFLSESPSVVVKKLRNKQPLNELCPESGNIVKTPLRSGNSRTTRGSSCNKSRVKETTYENVLTEAMNNLQLSFKNTNGEKLMNKSCLIDSPAYKTSVKRVTRSMCAKVADMPGSTCDESLNVPHDCEKSVRFEEPNDENKENLTGKERDLEPSPKSDQTSAICLELSETSTEHGSPEMKVEAKVSEKIEEVQPIQNQVPQKSKVVTSFSIQTNEIKGSKKKVSTLAGNAWRRQMKRRLSITNQRRMSVSKTLPNKYVSMAEAVTKFHRETPQRFHTVTVKTTRTEQLRRVSLKLTKAHSPALMCKNRVRPVTAMSSEERERLELEKIRLNQIKANPLRKNILERPAPLKKVEKKMITNPEPFHLTQSKKGQPSKTIQESKRAHRIQTKTVPSIVSTDDKSVIVKEEEVLYFGIPLEPGNSKKKITKVMPFSFEIRNKELQMKKQEKLKKMQESEQQKVKAEFHARPVPMAVKTPNLKKKEILHKPKITIAQTLSFEDRSKELQRKKEEKIKQMLEEERKARSFKAQKVPEFKPVLVRGTSRDNLTKKSNENLSKSCNVSGSSKRAELFRKNSHENLAIKQKNLIKQPISIPFIAAKKTNPPSMNTEDQENHTRRAVPKIMEPKCKISQKSIPVLTELNTDKRAKQRREFEEQLKRKELEEEMAKKREEEERIAKEKSEQQELRKMTEHKARPMPVYKPINILKSKKPLTDAQSPAWAKRKLTQTR
ncbi:hypothetical protein QAD02_019057 [Eretmocerus hayati]|uniref:Uncharacterized protein n=1 Tax=Eretmocerus hayati TaxID=131215 RepID=A0ACC2PN96_9HYME|nr:hypothetical protein QAD02_019057 [Eretmocerus hayati]